MSTKNPNNQTTQDAQQEHTSQLDERRAKLKALRAQAGPTFPNDFRRDNTAAELHQNYAQHDKEALVEQAIQVKLAGRMMTRRIMGKASFVHIQDMSGRMQLYIARDAIGTEHYADFKHWDLGDIIAVSGTLFLTKTGELSVKASSVQLLTKALRPLPDKYHGLVDQEQRFRQRYLDLIVNKDVRDLFILRSKIVAAMRRFFDEHDFLEVETPMLHPLIGGAAARPFITHHNALDMELYMRIAPELYLKRLVVGGMERVYEINRNFRNEGVSTRHNPEFTMLEFYQAYADYNDLMNFTEKLFRYIAKHVLDTSELTWQQHSIDLEQPFPRTPLLDAICLHSPGTTRDDLMQETKARALCDEHNIPLHKNWGLGKIHMELFEHLAEEHIIQPTFITEFPSEVSPLSRVNDDNPFFADRFELYAAGIEIANGFSELNDAEDQATRFQAQLAAKAAGEDETMSYDADYITALEHGLPPTAGEGIGIDRLVMLFTNSSSIRDVILFPLLRKQEQSTEPKTESKSK